MTTIALRGTVLFFDWFSVVVQTPNSAAKTLQRFQLQVEDRLHLKFLTCEKFICQQYRRVPNAFEPENSTAPPLRPIEHKQRRINHNRLLVANATKMCGISKRCKISGLPTGKFGSEHLQL